MKKFILTTIAIAMTSLGFAQGQTAHAQNAVLAELYGRGVHAYNSGNATDAYNYLSLAISNGLEDPRAYYFRGIVAEAAGRGYEAEADWQQGAELEARGKILGSIGRALTRFQGERRLKLEQIRQKARLDYLATSAARAQRGAAVPRAAAASNPGAAASAAVTPPPAPPAAAENPFADDLRSGDPKVQNDDALADAMNDPSGGVSSAAGDAGASGSSDPFGGGDAPAAADPFGGGDAAGDPFGGGGGGDPFGGGGGAMDDPFGGADPFGN